MICGEDGLERVPELYLVPEEGVGHVIGRGGSCDTVM